MTWAQAIIVYGVCWWLLLFMALPIGIKQQEEVQDGMSRAAPKKTNLRIKCIAVSILAVLVTWGIAWVINSGWVKVK